MRRAAFLVKGKTDAIVGETANDLLEISSGKNDLSRRFEFDRNLFDDADFVVCGLDFECSFFCFQKDAGEDRCLGFRGNSLAGHIDGFGELLLLTGEFHGEPRSLC